MTHAPGCPYGECKPGECPVLPEGHPAAGSDTALCECSQGVQCGLCSNPLKFERVSWVNPWGQQVHAFYAWCSEHYREWRKAT